MEGLIRGKPARPLLHAPDVERELQSVASSWTDDGVLAASPLADVAGAEEAEHARAEAVRRLFREALAAARAGAPDRGAAFKAVEMAYLDRSVSHERVAERMAVSRSTFYRLLKRDPGHGPGPGPGMGGKLTPRWYCG